MIPMRPLERGLHYVVVQRQVHFNDRLYDWPTLYFVRARDGCSPEVTRYELLDAYFEENARMSGEWQWLAAIATGMLAEYSIAKWSSSSRVFVPATEGGVERWLLRGFAKALVSGTVKPSKHGLTDALGLYWRPRSHDRAGRYLSALTRHLNYLGQEGIESSWSNAASTEHLQNDPYAAFRISASAAIRSKYSLLEHLGPSRGRAPHKFPGIVEPGEDSKRAIYSFPSHHVVTFLFKCFRCETSRLVAFILFAGGLRSSEPFHLFVSDIQFADKPVIFLHDPEKGIVRGANGRSVTREEYLADFWLTPRTLTHGPYEAGWKGVAGSLKGTPIYWLPVEVMTTHLATLLRRYLLYTRPRLMAQRPKSQKDHPFLFVSSGRTAESKGVKIGDPFTMSAFRSEWDRAIGRLSRITNDPEIVVRLELGTTPHGARHHYGRFLKSIGVPGTYIMDCMHHKSIFSHHVYAALLPSEISAELNTKGAAGMRDDFISQWRE